MTFFEVLIGFAIGLGIIVAAVFFSFRAPNLKSPSKHDVRSNGDHATGEHGTRFSSDGGGGDGGAD